MPKKVGVIGGGVVGQAINAYYKKVTIYDKHQPQDELAAVLDCDYIFIAVPTPYSNGFDLTEMNDSFSKLSIVNDKIIIIKSTVLPGTTDAYQFQYPQHQILFNPEFLTQDTAIDDFIHPDRQIIGYTAKSQDVAEEVLAMLPPAPYQKTMPAPAAELVKYMFNTFYATKVVFANQFYDLCQGLGIDYDLVKESFLSEKKNLFNHFEIWHKGYRGYSGKCLPKDLDSLVDLAEKNNIDLKLLKTVREINAKLSKAKRK
jgi:UDPglucose 6-dehydrogenase